MPQLDTKAIVDKLGEVEERMVGNQTTMQTMDDRVNELAAHFGEKGKFAEAEAAIQQLEESEKSLLADVQKMRQMAQRMSYSSHGSGQYRGIWNNEDQARSFGLVVMAKLGNKGAAEVLENEYAEVHERAMGETDEGAGGSLVQTEFYNRLLFWAEEYGVFFRKALRWPMGSDSGVFPTATNNIQVYCPGEGVQPTESQLATGVKGITAKAWHTLTYFSKELAADAAVQVGELIGRMIARAYAQKADEIGFLGDGSSVYFNETGVIPALVAAGRIYEYAGEDAYGEVTQDSVDEQMADIPQYADVEAEWYGHRKAVFGVLMRLARSAGGVTAAEIEGRRRLLHGGYPVNITQVMSSTQADEEVPLVFGDLRQAALWGDRQALTIEQSSHFKFGQGLETVLSTLRTAIRVVNTDAMIAGGLETTA